VRFGSANILLQHLEFIHMGAFRGLYKDMTTSEKGKECWKVLNDWEKYYKKGLRKAEGTLCPSIWKDPVEYQKQMTEWMGRIKPYCVNEYFECLEQENHVNFYAKCFKDCDIIAMQEYHDDFAWIKAKFPHHLPLECSKTPAECVTKDGYHIKCLLLIDIRKFEIIDWAAVQNTDKKDRTYEPAVVAKVMCKKTKTEFIVGSFHLKAKDTADDRKQRADELNVIKSAIEKLEEGTPLSHILGGDVNCPAGRMGNPEKTRSKIWNDFEEFGVGKGIFDKLSKDQNWKPDECITSYKCRPVLKDDSVDFDEKKTKILGDDVFISDKVKLLNYLQLDHLKDIQKEHKKYNHVDNGRMIRPSNPSDHAYLEFDLEIPASQ